MSRRVLLIDDNDDLRSQLADALRDRGWHVETARSGRLGLELAARTQPEVVLTELILPDVRGFHFASSLRSTVEYDLPVIALTRIPEQLHARARQAGFDIVHTKPIDVDELHASMTTLLSGSRVDKTPSDPPYPTSRAARSAT